MDVEPKAPVQGDKEAVVDKIEAEAPPEVLSDVDMEAKEIAEPEEKAEESKELAILRDAKDRALQEEEARTLFARYCDKGKDFWRAAQIRRLLQDIQIVFEAPPVVADEALLRVMRQFQCDSVKTREQRLNLVEFVSFMVYLHSQPLVTLHKQVATFAVPKLMENAVLVTHLPTTVTREDVADLFAACGTIVNSYIVPGKPKSQALVSFDQGDEQHVALELHGSSYRGALLGVIAYTGQPFPLPLPPRPGVVARGLATVVVGVRSFNQKVGVTRALAPGVQKVESFGKSTGAFFDRLDERTKFSATLSKVGKRLELGPKINKVVKRVNETSVMRKLSAGWGRLGSKLDKVVHKFSKETDVAIAERTKLKAKEAEKAAVRAAAEAEAKRPAVEILEQARPAAAGDAIEVVEEDAVMETVDLEDPETL